MFQMGLKHFEYVKSNVCNTKNPLCVSSARYLEEKKDDELDEHWVDHVEVQPLEKVFKRNIDHEKDTGEMTDSSINSLMEPCAKRCKRN